MKKCFTFLILVALIPLTNFSQVLNQPASWPNAGWTLSGTYNAFSLLSDPSLTANFSYDDDAAGSGSTDILNAESPVIDLSAASVAGETWIVVEYDYDYNLGDVFNLEYYDADLADWVVWEALPENSSAFSGWCAQISAPTVTSGVLDISTMTATQLSGFQYRFAYDASATWGWGFCVSSPTISSQTPPSCLDPSALQVSNVTSTGLDVSWTENGSATVWNIEYGAPGFVPGTGAELGSVVGTINNPETITGLTGGTSYAIYVQADCGVDGTSGWSAVASALTYGDCSSSGSYTYLNNSTLVSSLNGFIANNPGDYITLTFTGGSTESCCDDWFITDAANGAGNIIATGAGSIVGSYESTTGEISFYIVSDGSVGGQPFVYSLSCAPPPTCPRPIDLLVTSLTPNSAEISWTAGGLETEWEVEYGEAGFALGTGTSIITSTIPEQLTGLFDNTSYDVYVRAVCAPGDSSAWSTPSTFNTPCFAFEAIDFCESFDSDSETQACWTVLNLNGDADTWDLNYSFNTNSGDQVAALNTDFNGGNNDDWLITPQITLTGNEIMNFFYTVQSSFEPNDFEVLLSTTGKAPADFQDTLMFLASYNNTTYQDSTIDLSAYTGDVYIAFHVPAGGLDGWRLYIDDVCFDVCIPTAGQDGENDVCRADGLIDLNPSIVKGQENGAWVFPSNQQLVVDDTLFNVTTLPAGSYEVLWIVEGGCTSDTTVSVINVFPPSSAGVDGSIIACRNEPINLFDGLSGNLDLGGVWYNPSNAPLAGAITTTSNIPGSFNFLYITSNGVCAADTSLVEVIVGTCDFLSLGDEQFAELSVYPNPASDVLNIEASSNAGVMKIEISDINGRTVLVDASALANSTSTSLSIAHLENGVYTLRIFNNEGQRTFKIVKQ